MLVIAETSSNHNGNLEYLKELCLQAKNSNTDYVTVQIMNPKYFCDRDYSKFDVFSEISFDKSEWIELFEFCNTNEIQLIPCILDEESLQMVLKYGFKFIKIHATDILNRPLLTQISKHSSVDVLLETQCATLVDINYALRILGNQVKVLIHGYSNYPTDYNDLNLNSLDALKKEYPSLEIGFADHSLDDTEIPLMCLAKEIDYLEKHITLTRANRNYDWQVSLDPEEFKIMMATINKYRKALGNHFKHPTKTELPFRNVMYKKRISENQNRLVRSDKGLDNLTFEINDFSKDNIGIAIVARLKSVRLPKKVLKPLSNKPLIEVLYKRMQKSKLVNDVTIATSDHHSDQSLRILCNEQNLNVFAGHPESVIDRMLEYAIQEKIGGVFRVTGDNPLTSHEVVDEMITLFQENDLDYVKAIGLPFGVTAELFSTKYLWNLYQQMDNPMVSEYLSWFVLKDDNVRRGYLEYDIDSRLALVNYSVDYEEDYKRVTKLIESSGKDVIDINLNDIITNTIFSDLVDLNKQIKLPNGKRILYKDYMDQTNNAITVVKKNIKL